MLTKFSAALAAFCDERAGAAILPVAIVLTPLLIVPAILYAGADFKDQSRFVSNITETAPEVLSEIPPEEISSQRIVLASLGEPSGIILDSRPHEPEARPGPVGNPWDWADKSDASGMTTLRTRAGKTYVVSAKYAQRFRCLVGKLEETGYRIDMIGGYSKRKIAGTGTWSNHAFGMAIDINQTGRHRVTRKLPSNISSMARSCGLLHGGVWRNPDQGHFEVAGASRVRAVASRKTKRKTAKRSKYLRAAAAPKQQQQW